MNKIFIADILIFSRGQYALNAIFTTATVNCSARTAVFGEYLPILGPTVAPRVKRKPLVDAIFVSDENIQRFAPLESLVNVFEELILLAITSLSLVAELVVLMEHEQPVIETSSVSAARKYLSTTPPCTRGRPKSRSTTRTDAVLEKKFGGGGARKFSLPSSLPLSLPSGP